MRNLIKYFLYKDAIYVCYPEIKIKDTTKIYISYLSIHCMFIDNYSTIISNKEIVINVFIHNIREIIDMILL